MPEEYELHRVLEEIVEDEKVSKPKHKKITQQEIRKILLEKKKGLVQTDENLRIPLAESPTHEGQIAEQAPSSIETLLQQFVRSGGSDLFIGDGASPTLKIGVSLARTRMHSITAEQSETYARALMTDKQWEEFLKEKQLEFAVAFESTEGRFRVSAYRQKNTVSLAIRRIGNSIPTFEELGLPEWLEDYVLKPRGLILVTAPPGHGKSTTIASMIDLINRNRRANIITLEDPIEYLHTSQSCNINQREVGTDTGSILEGLRKVSRQSPDVVMVGEMQDHETFEAALKVASTGHLVLCATNACSATAAIDDMMNRLHYHLQNQVRRQLSDALLIVFSQRLMPRKDANGVILAHEKLINSSRIKSFIRKNRVYDIRTKIRVESDDFCSMDIDLKRLVDKGVISLESALEFVEDPENFLDIGL